DPVHVDPAKVDPVHVDPAKVDPVHVDPAKVDPVHVDPVHVDPAAVEVSALTFETRPAGAEVYDGDFLLGVTPFTLKRQKGTVVELRFVLKNHLPQVRKLRFEATARVNIELEQKQAAAAPPPADKPPPAREKRSKPPPSKPPPSKPPPPKPAASDLKDLPF
ncbi:MAG: hypothetical protein H6Q89_5646, partial [Myxococcaceae bacterium]|nr:hypothetical protein [Myxococcaceae bacterium]